MSISLDAQLGESVRAAAARSDQGLSSWLAQAASAKLRAEALDQFLTDWDRTNRPITEEEIAQARVDLGLERPIGKRARATRKGPNAA